ncbi:OmpA family protein [Acidicapsa ligni]|uniref:OmpA family protein n=1 Tax=Acidicapsa ligni TaxID=542300 RepID=UPI0021E04E7E|nr:OmpA family protein [Acidicapsa ligni]
MNFRIAKSVVLAVAAGACLMSASAFAQDNAAPKPTAPADAAASRWDIFVGYSYLAPHGTVQVLQSSGQTLPFDYKAVNVGGLFSGAYYFNRYVGAQIEYGEHDYDSSSNNDSFQTGSAGLIFRYPTSDITPFAHALVGGAYVGGPDHEPNTWGPALTVGGGMDYNTPLFHHRLAIRLFQADYEYIHANFGPGVFGGRANIDAARLSGGVVLHVGSIVPPPPVTLACSASPASVFPGEPITITATAGELNPKKKATYTWSGNGVTGSDATATVATASLAPGTYSAKGSVSEGPKPGQSAECSASFTVKAFEPPTVSCSANPTTIKPGDTSAITATGVSPQNRPLTYSYSASAGTVSGTGGSATFSSAGAAAGTATVTCTVTDDKGQTATATTPVTIEAPYVAPAPTASALCSITFEKDKKRPARVDNEAKACLDDIALTLQKQSDATAAIVGSSTADEKTPPKGHKHAKVEDLAAQRAVNTKDYLVTEKGIDASRITVYTGSGDGKKVEDYLVPSGATFSVDGTTKVSDDVKAQPRKAMAAKHHSKKKSM